MNLDPMDTENMALITTAIASETSKHTDKITPLKAGDKVTVPNGLFGLFRREGVCDGFFNKTHRVLVKFADGTIKSYPRAKVKRK